jgi:hypothetical protein
MDEGRQDRFQSPLGGSLILAEHPADFGDALAAQLFHQSLE